MGDPSPPIRTGTGREIRAESPSGWRGGVDENERRQFKVPGDGFILINIFRS